MAAFFCNQLFQKFLIEKYRLSQIFHKFQFFKVKLKSKAKWISIQ
ncbi:hypothetical protein ES708_07863 [subsurface metagenome]